MAFLVGAGDPRAADHVAAQGLWLSAGLGLLSAALVGGLARPAAVALGGSGEVLTNAVTYLRISALGTPFVLVALVGHGYLRGVQDTRTPLAVAVGANLLNLGVELVLVYGLDLGVAGSAWGTVLAQVVAAAVFLGVLTRRLRMSGASLAVDRHELLRLAQMGRHLFVRTAALLTTLTLATSVAARVDPPTLAGHQIALQIETFLALAVDALAIAAQALTGAALGAGDVSEARRTGRRLVRMGLLAGAALCIVVVATAWLLPHIFTGDAAVVSTRRRRARDRRVDAVAGRRRVRARRRAARRLRHALPAMVERARACGVPAVRRRAPGLASARDRRDLGGPVRVDARPLVGQCHPLRRRKMAERRRLIQKSDCLIEKNRVTKRPPIGSQCAVEESTKWRSRTMYHFAVAALLALATLKVVDLLEGLMPAVSRGRSLLTFALAVGAAVALDFSVFAGYHIAVRETWMGTWGTGLIIGSLATVLAGPLRVPGRIGPGDPGRAPGHPARVAA